MGRTVRSHQCAHLIALWALTLPPLRAMLAFEKKIEDLTKSLSPCQFVVVMGHDEPSLFPQISQDMIAHAHQVLLADIKVLPDLSHHIRLGPCTSASQNEHYLPGILAK